MLQLYILETFDQKDPYDFVIQALVAAESVEAARNMHPYGPGGWTNHHDIMQWTDDPSKVKVRHIGTYAGVEPGVVMLDRNNG